MIRALLRLVVVVVLLAAIAAFFFGYRWGGAGDAARPADSAIGTSGGATTSDRARETGAELGEKVAAGAARAGAALDETRLTAKVKSKIALDDTLKGSDVSVHTSGTTVTVDGRVATAAQHERVLQLARETAGVTQVVDHVSVR
jgi:osmotically-inducible protein OsmY